MKITQVLLAEHGMFRHVFEEIERVLPECGTLAEVKRLASIVEGLVRPHGETEADLAYAVLDQALAERGALDQLYQDHEEIDATLTRVGHARTCAEARQLLQAALRHTRDHFEFEEREVFTLFERWMQGESLAVLGAAWLRQRSQLQTSAP
jgi:hemerythrin-like domain-containing protein